MVYTIHLFFDEDTIFIYFFLASVTMSNTSASFTSSVRIGPSSNNTFVHFIIKMTLKKFNKTLTNSSGEGNLASCQILFSLLKNLAMAPECRGILYKVTFYAFISIFASGGHIGLLHSTILHATVLQFQL